MDTKQKLEIILANPRGFCAGVDRAIAIVEKSLEKYGSPVYVRHEIVHNKFVIDNLKEKGAIFVESLDDIKDNTRPVIFSAHGVPKSVPARAEERKMIYIDATCPLVSKVHHEAILYNKQGFQVILIGHKGHPEVIGTMGQLPEGSVLLLENIEDIKDLPITTPDKLAYVTQTTLSVEDTHKIVESLKESFPNITTPKKEDICYATTNRQDAVKEIAPKVNAFIIIGSSNSSNSNRLVEVAKNHGCPKSFLIQNVHEINWAKLVDIKTLGISAGASAPEVLVQEVLDYTNQYFEATFKTHSVREENLTFKLPSKLVA